MSWFVVWNETTGRLVSQGTVVADPLRAGLVARDEGVKPDDSLMWDETTLAFVPRPAKVLIDRVEDVVTDGRIAAAIGRLTPPQLDAVKTVLGEILGTRRFRNANSRKEL